MELEELIETIEEIREKPKSQYDANITEALKKGFSIRRPQLRNTQLSGLRNRLKTKYPNLVAQNVTLAGGDKVTIIATRETWETIKEKLKQKQSQQPKSQQPKTNKSK